MDMSLKRELHEEVAVPPEKKRRLDDGENTIMVGSRKSPVSMSEYEWHCGEMKI